MCYSKPGPRCSDHCRKDLAKARAALSVLAAAGVDTASPQSLTRYHKAKERLAACKSRYDRTPEGRRSMEAEADSVATKAPQYSQALVKYSRDGVDNRQVQKRKLRAHEWNQQSIHDKFLGEVVTAQWEYDQAQIELAGNKDAAAREALRDASDRLQHAENDFCTTKEGQREAAAAEFSLRAEASGCTIARRRESLLRQADEQGAWRRDMRRERLRQLAEYNAMNDVRERLDKVMAEQRAKEVAPVAPRRVPQQRPAAPTKEPRQRAGAGAAWGSGAQTITILSHDRKGVTILPDR